jgi:hypothetical protein
MSRGKSGRTDLLRRYIAAALTAVIGSAVLANPASPAFAVGTQALGATGPVSINEGAQYTRTAQVSVAVPATGATHVRLSNNDSLWAEMAYAPTVAWNLVDATYGGVGGAGAKTVYVQWSDDGASWSASQSDEITFDPSSPLAFTGPVHGFSIPAKVGAGRVAMTISWIAQDAHSGVVSYRVQEWTSQTRKFRDIQLPTPLTTSVRRFLTPGVAYQYRFRARDGAGNTMGWTAGYRFKVKGLPEWQGTYSGGWRDASFEDALGGGVRYSDAEGATATFTFRADTFALVGIRGPRGGRADVYFKHFTGNFYKVGSFSLRADEASFRDIVWRWRFKSTDAGYKSHTIKIVVRGTPGHPRVWIDALLQDVLVTD